MGGVSVLSVHIWGVVRQYVRTTNRLQKQTGTIGICASRRYVTRRGTLIASYNWHVAQDFHFRMKMSLDA
jgi:hypothetical protein